MPSVTAVSASSSHTFSKPLRASIKLLAGIGIEGDAHAGELVRHRYLVGRDASQPNLRQVHLIQEELFEALASKGHEVRPGELGENITTSGVDLLALPTGAILHLGDDAVVELTGLRNPCPQIEAFRTGLMGQLRRYDPERGLIRTGGVMGIVLSGGSISPGDNIEIQLPAEPRQELTYIVDSHNPVRVPGTA